METLSVLPRLCLRVRRAAPKAHGRQRRRLLRHAQGSRRPSGRFARRQCRTCVCPVEFTDLIASSIPSELLQFERGAIHALNTSRKETYLRLGAINNPAITIANLHSLIDQHCNS